MMTTIMVLLFVMTLTLLLWQISNIVSVFYGSPYVMADKKVISEALRLAKLKKGEIFYDLGCGRGDVLIEAAKFGAKATGFEISPYYYIYVKLKTRRYHNIPNPWLNCKASYNPQNSIRKPCRNKRRPQRGSANREFNRQH